MLWSAWLWTPAVPFSLPRDSLLVWPLRLIRLSYTLALAPLHVLLVLCHSTSSLVTPYVLPSWSTSERLALPILRRVIWSVASIGRPPEWGAKGERRVPISTTLVQNYFSTGRKVHILQEDITLSRASLAQWIKGDALDPRGEVVVESGLPVFWLHVKAGLNDQEEAERLMGQGEKRDRVILWLVGGGYIGGSPVQGTRCFDAARETGLRVMGANYRKATRPEWAFPAALQDAIVAYAHLVELGYHEIVVAGDSAGAGLATALLIYLSKLVISDFASGLPNNFVLPHSLLLYSPWVDLTKESFLRGTTGSKDFITPAMLKYAADAYLINTVPRPHVPLSVALDSPFALGARHPLISPALPSALATMELIPQAYTLLGVTPPLRVFIASGGAELLASSIAQFCENWRALQGVQTEWHVEKDALHVYQLLPHAVSPGPRRNLARVGKFLSL